MMLHELGLYFSKISNGSSAIVETEPDEQPVSRFDHRMSICQTCEQFVGRICVVRQSENNAATHCWPARFAARPCGRCPLGRW